MGGPVGPAGTVIPGRRWVGGWGAVGGRPAHPPLAQRIWPSGAEGRYLQHCCKGTRMESSSWEYFPNLQEGKRIVQGRPQAHRVQRDRDRSLGGADAAPGAAGACALGSEVLGRLSGQRGGQLGLHSSTHSWRRVAPTCEPPGAQS